MDRSGRWRGHHIVRAQAVEGGNQGIEGLARGFARLLTRRRGRPDLLFKKRPELRPKGRRMPAVTVEVSRAMFCGQSERRPHGPSDDLAAEGRSFQNIHRAERSGGTCDVDPGHRLLAYRGRAVLLVSRDLQLSEVALKQ